MENFLDTLSEPNVENLDKVNFEIKRSEEIINQNNSLLRSNYSHIEYEKIVVSIEFEKEYLSKANEIKKSIMGVLTL